MIVESAVWDSQWNNAVSHSNIMSWATLTTMLMTFLFLPYKLTSFLVCFFSSFLFGPQALNKKEHRGCDSPEADVSYVLTPNTEEKYKKINEEFDNMMKSHKVVRSPVDCPLRTADLDRVNKAMSAQRCFLLPDSALNIVCSLFVSVFCQ